LTAVGSRTDWPPRNDSNVVWLTVASMGESWYDLLDDEADEADNNNP
jgi:hypothetical protein